MIINTEADCIGEIEDREGFCTLSYEDGSKTRLPNGFVTMAGGNVDNFYIGKCSAFGEGSEVWLELPDHALSVGRYVSAGKNIKFMLAGFHETRTISTCEFGTYDETMKHVNQHQYPKIEIKNDVWIGDDVLIMGGTIVENGCVIGARSVLPANFKTEPYGIYAGIPAKLKKFRFSEEIRKALINLSWWDMPLTWVKENNKYFLADITGDGGEKLLEELNGRKK